MISAEATKCAVVSGKGKPSFVNLPTPWLGYTNFKIPSKKNTAPAISLIIRIEAFPSTGGFENQLIIFFMTIYFLQKLKRKGLPRNYLHQKEHTLDNS